ncbi:MAG: 4-hydroxythreonine-4-phosphate dehydrogenase PdxA [Phycisphaerales bacterium]|nr:MAG: 4-hydroxythreonine-4-phosphate dehydrogenase PdxA [Phycisphaerales bacterium]
MTIAREGNPPRHPTLLVTLGDPGGIGPEVVVKALAAALPTLDASIEIIGVEPHLEDAARKAGIKPFWAVSHESRTEPSTSRITLTTPIADLPATFDARPSAINGRASFLWVRHAIARANELHARGHPVAVVTGPISKEAWALAGFAQFPGHTELFAHDTGAIRHAMMFESPRLRVVLATAHVPLADVPKVLTTQRVLDAIELGAAACVRLGIERPRLAVLGLNPHAGEHGLLGGDEQLVIIPAIEHARSQGLDVQGPFPADTIYRDCLIGAPSEHEGERRGSGGGQRKAEKKMGEEGNRPAPFNSSSPPSSSSCPPALCVPRSSRFDLAVAMYHDQGLIPLKLLAFESAVNCTLGLPFPRTSPDHGTAFAIAGENHADPSSMLAALHLAARLA